MTRTKVAILHNLPAPYRLQLFEKLLKDDELDVRIFFTGRPRSNRPSWTSDFHSGDSRIIFLPEIALPIKGGSADALNLNSGIGRIFKWKPDVVVLYGYQEFTNILVAMLCSILRIPYVLSAEISGVWTSTRIGRISKPVVRAVVSRASSLAPASRSAADFFRSLSGNGREMRIIPPIPDVEALAARAASVKQRSIAIRSRLGFAGRFGIVFVGRLENYKGIQEMFDALDMVVTRDPNAVLLVVGKGSLQQLVESRCRTHNRNCIYLGSLDDNALLEVLVSCDLHILPSWHEAYGVICAEALSCGVPSVVTATSGCSDLIEDGVNGFIIEPRNATLLAEAILKVSTSHSLLQSMKGSALVNLKAFYMGNLHASLKELILSAIASKK